MLAGSVVVRTTVCAGPAEETSALSLPSIRQHQALPGAVEIDVTVDAGRVLVLMTVDATRMSADKVPLRFEIRNAKRLSEAESSFKWRGPTRGSER